VKLLLTALLLTVLASIIGCEHDVREPGQPNIQAPVPLAQ